MHAGFKEVLEYKAYNEWVSFISSLWTIYRRIVDNPKGKLALSIRDAHLNWGEWDQFKRMDLLSVLMHECSHVFNVSTPLLYTRSSWAQKRQAYRLQYMGGEPTYLDSFEHMHDLVDGFFVPYEGETHIVITRKDGVSKDSFFYLLNLFAHELGHAIHAEYTEGLIKNLGPYYETGDRWQVPEDSAFLNDPIFTVLLLKAYEDEEATAEERDGIIKSWELGESGKDYYDIFSERIAETFAQEFCVVIKAAMWDLETGNLPLDRANAIIRKAQGLAKDIQKHILERNSPLVLEDKELMDLRLCQNVEELYETSRYDVLNKFWRDADSVWKDLLKGMGEDYNQYNGRSGIDPMIDGGVMASFITDYIYKKEHPEDFEQDEDGE